MYCTYLLYIVVHTVFSVRVRHVIPVYHVLHIPPLHSIIVQYFLFVYAVVCSLAFFKIKPDDQVLAPLQICNYKRLQNPAWTLSFAEGRSRTT